MDLTMVAIDAGGVVVDCDCDCGCGGGGGWLWVVVKVASFDCECVVICYICGWCVVVRCIYGCG